MSLLRLLRPASRRSWWLLAFAALLAAVVFMPLRLAFALVDTPLAARQAAGTIWSGRLADAQLGGLPLGTLDVGLRPLSLLAGRLSFDIARIDAHAPPLRGRIGTGLGGYFVDDLTGSIGGAALGRVPVERITADALSVRFSGRRCVAASGRVRLSLAADVAGMTLRNGLAGPVRCDGEALLLNLAGDSGVERLTLRIFADGHYRGGVSVGGATLLRLRGRF